MGTGAITGYIDVAQIALYVFWGFFIGLIWYLHREDKREGYPLESDRSGGRVKVQGWPAVPRPKTYLLRSGETVHAPNSRPTKRTLALRPGGTHLGAPYVPTGNPMLDGVGPASYAERADVPDLTVDDEPRIVPLRAAPGFELSHHDRDPRGTTVYGADGLPAGKVVDIWVDRAETVFRYFEVETAGRRRRVLLPVNFTRIDRRGVTVRAILSTQFDDVPAVRQPDQVTLLEEDKVMGYYGGGVLYATPQRQEPLL